MPSSSQFQRTRPGGRFEISRHKIDAPASVVCVHNYRQSMGLRMPDSLVLSRAGQLGSNCDLPPYQGHAAFVSQWVSRSLQWRRDSVYRHDSVRSNNVRRSVAYQRRLSAAWVSWFWSLNRFSSERPRPGSFLACSRPDQAMGALLSSVTARAPMSPQLLSPVGSRGLTAPATLSV